MYLLNKIDSLLNSITTYRLVLYVLLIQSAFAIILGFLNLLPYSGVQFILTLLTVVIVSYVSNTLLSWTVKAVVNVESWLITALILFLVLAPINNFQDFIVTTVIAIVAMASKYFLTYDKRHIFNPAALAMFLAGLFGFGNSIWWVGSSIMLPVVLVTGLLVVRKIRRFRLVIMFLVTAVLTVSVFNYLNGIPLAQALIQVFTSWPLIFFATIMLTEPFTTPPNREFRNYYGVFTGALFGSQFSIGPLYASPELALVAGNFVSFLLSPKGKLILKFKQRNQLAPAIFEFIFSHNGKYNFTPGQYLEWTLPHPNSDSRGVRRYFTIASSPEEPDLRLGVKIIPDKSSSFKKALLALQPGSILAADQLSGDFVLPKNPAQKLVFIAGGIGVTPFRSMVNSLIINGAKKDVVLFYSAADPKEFVYKDIFSQAEVLGLKTIYVFGGKEVPPDWQGETGFLNEAMLRKYVPDLKERKFYMSGPVAMVNNYKGLLKTLGISNSSIVTDYFPGF